MSEAREEAKKEFAKQAVALAFMVAALMIMAAVHNPDFLRTRQMRMAAAWRRRLDAAARRCGYLCMGGELATGRQQYAIPLILSTLRDRAAAAYEKARRS